MNTINCKLCNSTCSEIIEYKQEKYYYCSGCELIFLDENFIPGPAEEKARYQEHDNTHQNEGYVKMFERFINRALVSWWDGVETVLEFGCGPGPVLADLLEDEGFLVDKYDPCFFPEKVYKNKKYDLITATEVFEHLQAPFSVMELLLAHLSEKGLLAIMTSFHPGPEKFKDWWYKWDPTHICFFNESTFSWLAEEFSLNIKFIGDEKYCLLQK